MTSVKIDLSLPNIVRAVLEQQGLTDWNLREDGSWCHVNGPAPVELIQGWKLHVSATPLSAPHVLHAAADVLLSARCPFKFAPGLDRVEELTSVRYDRAQAGKFLAAYPRDEAHFHQVAAALCDATDGLPGPRILSDRPYRAASIVQYRYGAFRGVRTLTNDGSFEVRLQAPDGGTATDHRKPWFAPPSWAAPLSPRPSSESPAGPAVPSAAAPASAAGGPPLLADGRFEVREAIRQSARGGVYRATDRSTGRSVIIKQARAHIGATRTGSDSRDLLAHEGRVLAALAPLTPAALAEFSQGEYAFLVEELVEGRSLTEHIASTANRRGRSADERQVRRLAEDVIRLASEVHARGWVLRDLSSGNLIVTPLGSVVLIDPEFAARPGDRVNRVFTPGFAAPEVMAGPIYGPAPHYSADVFAVGAVLMHLLLGLPPAFAPDDDSDRSTSDRIAAILDLAAQDLPLVRRWRPLLAGLTDAFPGRRWSLAQAAEFLRCEGDSGTARSVPVSRRDADEPAAHLDGLIDRIVDDGLEYLAAGMQPDRAWLWPTDGFGSSTDPLNVQYGAAGVLSVLGRAAADRESATARTAVRTAADWIGKRIDEGSRVLPGLYFGRAGTAWALREAATLLRDPDLAERAEEFGRRIPLRWPNPDVCHGAAGAGLSQLRLWQLSGQPDFLARARTCADGLLAAAQETDDGTFWPVAEAFDSSLAGVAHLGFGHGVAGVGAFLLAIGQLTGDQGYLDMASAAGRTLAANAEVDAATGAAVWRTERRQPVKAQDMLFHWCSGASGVGTFLVRLAVTEPDRELAGRYRELVDGAAIAVHRARWISSTAACHGLAGNAQFLLDAAAVPGTDSSRYRRWARDLAAVVVARHTRREGRLIVPDESGLKVAPGYSTGLAGVLDLLLRLRHGGDRSWMIETAL